MAQSAFRRGQAEIQRFILDNDLQAGDALPPEGELASQFGMSRPTMREAIKGLETVGVLTSRQGDAIRVAEFSFAPIIENLPYSFQASGRSFKDLLELRESLEEGLSARVLRVLRPHDLDVLESVARAMAKDGLDQSQIGELDRRFHSMLFAPLDNKLVNQLIELFWEAFHRMQDEYDIPVPGSDHLVEVHLNIVQTMRLGDESALIQAIRAHFREIHDWVAVHYTAAPGIEPSLPEVIR